MSEQKRCYACGESKSLAEFSRDRRRKDGRQSRCKVCHRSTSKAWAEANPDKRTETQRQYAARNRAKQEEAQQRHRELHPEKAKARKAVQDAVAQGRIEKPTACQQCGAPTPRRLLDGHHADYSKPLEVEWLCKGCHAQRHSAPGRPSMLERLKLESPPKRQAVA